MCSFSIKILEFVKTWAGSACRNPTVSTRLRCVSLFWLLRSRLTLHFKHSSRVFRRKLAYLVEGPQLLPGEKDIDGSKVFI